MSHSLAFHAHRLRRRSLFVLVLSARTNWTDICKINSICSCAPSAWHAHGLLNERGCLPAAPRKWRVVRSSKGGARRVWLILRFGCCLRNLRKPRARCTVWHGRYGRPGCTWGTRWALRAWLYAVYSNPALLPVRIPEPR